MIMTTKNANNKIEFISKIKRKKTSNYKYFSYDIHIPMEIIRIHKFDVLKEEDKFKIILEKIK